MQAYINNTSALGANVEAITATASTYQLPAGQIINRQGFYSIDCVAPYHAAIANGNTLGIGFVITQSDTSATLLGASQATLSLYTTVFTGSASTVTVDGIATFGFDARSYNQYMKIQPYVVFSATTTDTCKIGEVVFLANADKLPKAG